MGYSLVIVSWMTSDIRIIIIATMLNVYTVHSSSIVYKLSIMWYLLTVAHIYLINVRNFLLHITIIYDMTTEACSDRVHTYITPL